MADNKKPNLNMRYYNGEIDDDLPYVGGLNLDEETGLIYDEEGDVVDLDTIAAFCQGDGKGDED
ncbi:MAG: hypothetical protein IJA23_02365 [Clostridia bacterium]|nr:hypothetical protein [Clostridia bacterium]